MDCLLQVQDFHYLESYWCCWSSLELCYLLNLLWLNFRRKHKKGQEEEQQKRRTRRTHKFQRAIVGASLSEIQAKRNMKPEVSYDLMYIFYLFIIYKTEEINHIMMCSRFERPNVTRLSEQRRRQRRLLRLWRKLRHPPRPLLRSRRRSKRSLNLKLKPLLVLVENVKSSTF